MENYTKYALKPLAQLQEQLAKVDDIFVISCNKCFKEFTVLEEPELAEFLAIAKDMGKNITGSARADFLCNSFKTKNKLAGMIPEGTKAVFVISCGPVSYTHLTLPTMAVV